MAPLNATLNSAGINYLAGWVSSAKALFTLPFDLYAAIALAGFTAFLLWACIVFIYQPLRLIGHLRKQGIRGPPWRFFVGNQSEFVESERVVEKGGRPLTHLDKWKKEYGPIFYFRLGSTVILVPIDPGLVKQILHGTTGNAGLYQKDPSDAAAFEPVFGRYGLIFIVNERWARHRRILNPEFHIGKLKEMAGPMVRHTQQMVHCWDTRIAAAGGRAEIEVHEEISMLACDITCETLFGYENGAKQAYEEAGVLYKDIMVLIQDCGERAFALDVTSVLLRMIPGYTYLPVPINRRISRVHLRLRAMVSSFINHRRSATATANTTGELPKYGKDMLGGLLSAADEGLLSSEELMSECMTLFFAGHDSTSHSITWALMLLAQHPEWQERAREEVRTVCGDSPPNKESVNNLRLITMVFRETLRLFPPVVFAVRQATKDHQLGDLHILKGQRLLMPILTLHMDTDFWGEDAETFNPARFENGLSAASKDAAAYLPFSMGPRSCPGQSYAIEEAKNVLAMLLQNFRFSMAPGYRHWPQWTFTQRPTLGLQLLVEKA